MTLRSGRDISDGALTSSATSAAQQRSRVPAGKKVQHDHLPEVQDFVQNDPTVKSAKLLRHLVFNLHFDKPADVQLSEEGTAVLGTTPALRYVGCARDASERRPKAQVKPGHALSAPLWHAWQQQPTRASALHY